MLAVFHTRTAKTAMKTVITTLKRIMEVVKLGSDRLWIYPDDDAGKRKRDPRTGHVGTQGTL
jgi:hypothetical protein